MPRRNKIARHRHNPQAHREKQSRFLKAYRMVDEDSSNAIAGVIHELALDGELPKMTDIPHRHRAFILDPRLVKKEFKSGFTAGYEFNRARDRIQNRDSDDRLHASIGKIIFLSGSNQRYRHIGMYVQSSEAVEERKEVYRILNETGLSGFTEKKIRRPGSPLIILGTTIEPVYDKEERNEYQVKIETGLIIHQATELTLNELQIIDRGEH
jgi:hypothetical protein